MKLEVFFDYTCPYCYVTLHELNQILPQYPELSVAWCPCELNPRPKADAVLGTDSSNAAAQSVPDIDWDYTSGWLAELMPRIKQAGLVLNPPFRLGNYSDLAIQGLLYLVEQGADAKLYNDAVYQAVFSDCKDIEDLEVLSHCAAFAGADVSAFREAVISGAHKEQQMALTQYGWGENALDSVPSFRLGNARLNAVYGVGVSREQLTAFLEAQIAELFSTSTRT